MHCIEALLPVRVQHMHLLPRDHTRTRSDDILKMAFTFGRRSRPRTALVSTYALEALVCSLLRFAFSDCPPHLNSTTVAIRAEGQQTALQDALLSLETPASGNCTQIHLGAGIHYLTQSVHTLQNVAIQRDPDSYNDSKPVIRCAGGVRRAEEVDDDDDEQLSATVSFSNVSYAEISGIIFEYCPLPLQFLDVKYLRVEKSIFRCIQPSSLT